ncbi:hypothetical protein X942_5966 [Burkholderia pseudomallei MSHR5596]|nr:hypothetical protein X942_5966 [Burkholderia pseudomallei MSHR5596]
MLHLPFSEASPSNGLRGIAQGVVTGGALSVQLRSCMRLWTSHPHSVRTSRSRYHRPAKRTRLAELTFLLSRDPVGNRLRRHIERRGCSRDALAGLASSLN